MDLLNNDFLWYLCYNITTMQIFLLHIHEFYIISCRRYNICNHHFNAVITSIGVKIQPAYWIKAINVPMVNWSFHIWDAATIYITVNNIFRCLVLNMNLMMSASQPFYHTVLSFWTKTWNCASMCSYISQFFISSTPE